MFDIEFASGWQHLAKLPSKRQGHTLVMVGKSSVAVIGGYDTTTTTYLNTVDVWDTRARVWTSFKLNEARGGCAAVSIGNQLYVIGGYNSAKKRLSSMEMIDLSLPNAKAIILSPLPTARDESSAIVCKERYIVVVGGRDRTSCLNVVEMYDTETYKWSELPSMQEKRRLFGMGGTGQHIMVAGGHNGVNTLASAEMFDFNTMTWSPLPAMRAARHTCGGAVVSSGKTFTFLVGGGSGHTSVETYSSHTGTWSRIGALTEISGPCKMTMVEDQIVAAGDVSLVSLRFTPGGISNDQFIKRMLELPKSSNVQAELEQLGNSLGRLPQLQMYYSILHVQYMLGTLTKNQWRDLILNALSRCAVMCNSEHHYGFYISAVMKAAKDDAINEIECEQLKDKAARAQTDGSDFFREQRSMLQSNVERLREFESVKEAVYNNILSIWKNLDMMRRNNQEALWTREVLQAKLMAEQDDIEDSKAKVVAINNKFRTASAKRVEAGTSFCSAVMSIVYMASYRDSDSAASNLFARVVDFSDVHHVYNICKNMSNSRLVQESFLKGLSIAKNHDDMKLMECVQKEATICLIGTACGFVSEIYQVSGDNLASSLTAAPTTSFVEREQRDLQQTRSEIVEESPTGREGVEKMTPVQEEVSTCGCGLFSV